MQNRSVRKGIILAGGNGTRLAPITNSVSKQLLPVYDKPMIYYPLGTLLLAGITEILIITTPHDKESFINLLGNGNEIGISIKYKIQPTPDGLAQAFLIGEEFINKSPSVLILGDNLFHGSDLVYKLQAANNNLQKNTIFAYSVNDPQRYGVVSFDKNGRVIDIEEKPKNPKSNQVTTGLYFYDETAVEKAKQIKPSLRGELEITSLNQLYLQENNLNVEVMGRGTTWLDTGTFDSLHQAGSYIRILEKRQGLKIGSPHEIAWNQGLINDNDLEKLAKKFEKSEYGNYLKNLLKEIVES
ncbi:MAG: glucose-1-phosphate thymidylyltransferase [Pelagibacteraceae bacterium TMED124]|nr:MAG: glucose-1-phosphate thymidylyltransferase [Pelagibacteraceae bacterium TMED124]|tara:strand:- start:4541 stop:5437 length:897 start_codon:yes stop_codon:yes gene_type:complete